MINILLNLYNFHEKWCFETLKDILKEEYSVLVIPFSFNDDWMKNDNEWQTAYNPITGKYYKDIVIPFLSYGIKAENINWINYFNDTKDSSKYKINNSDIIFFTGGLPDQMMDRLKEFKIIEDIENYKGIVMGSSAGAMVQVAQYHITPDKDYDSFSYNEGLNMITDFDIEVHYKETSIQKESIKKVLKEKSRRIYAMKDKGGIIINGEKITILGDVTLFDI
ncbi:MAG: Type 1 glutamine amidotransferase-like domain-containing protein [Paeniclostridium sp.]|uniref:Type 1 glutamine amidotransferase-like domain-containing protein n=1 Tax=Paraclostridium sordellii TaxID=1505 RepID=UPI0005E7C8B9|nr:MULTISPECIES: Type 1 glutamine amidotransferase-like domain-containing protein [Paeniclostridium]MBW4862964.1 Type 1 glutamine amidotransferase-like domain-containing protein [Paeniclostridium sp.]MBW4874969.1 Type 1 glutamine amidotransferase-like domain-containing protein [Paeniclostridium sp.]CEN93616.1 peptidase E-like protein [[Clostridium] sordellii] [Paeniclostridium sordellii]CEN94652.1 peptidase E-like protein [[Clostridium] sordellii] [Paeniclostridium sordellii]